MTKRAKNYEPPLSLDMDADEALERFAQTDPKEINALAAKSKKTGITTHEVKTLDKYFIDVLEGRKRFEVRLNDRDYKVGDILRQHRYGPDQQGRAGYLKGSRRVNDPEKADIVEHRIDYILDGGQFGLEKGFVVLQLEEIE